MAEAGGKVLPVASRISTAPMIPKDSNPTAATAGLVLA
jgi:hypothetical protein